MVALEEKGLSYKLETVPLPFAAEKKLELQRRGMTGKVPLLVHRIELPEVARRRAMDLRVVAISEYLAERFPMPSTRGCFPPISGTARMRARSCRCCAPAS